MLDYVVQLLYQKGYRKLDDENGVLYRETEHSIYVVTLSTFRKEVTRQFYENAATRVEFLVATRFRKRVEILHLIAVSDGMFENGEQQLVDGLPNAWLIAADTGRIYVFEHQINEFDGLHVYLEEGLQSVRSVRRKNAFSLQPVTIALVVLNVIYYGIITVAGRGEYDNLDFMLKMGAFSYETFTGGAWYQILTSLFVHFGLTHLLNNMVLLLYVGSELESRIGKIRFAGLYLFTGIVGNAVSLWYYHSVGNPAVSGGASGAIFGVIGALILVLIMSRARTRNITARRLIVLVCITIYYGMSSMGVDNAAHIGGFVSGIVSGFLLSKISQYGKLE